MKAKKLMNDRYYINKVSYSHIVWNRYNSDSPWKKGLVVHHKDGEWNGRHHSEETKIKLSYQKIGNKNPMYGQKHSLEWKEKMSFMKKGIPRSEEIKKKISISNMGNKNRLGQKSTEEHKRKISESIKKWHECRKNNSK